MSEPVYVAVICEGPTERNFVEAILAPHFEPLGIYLTPTILTKKGEKVDGKLEKLRSFERFLPYFVMHEIEALYFSCPATLAAKIGVDVAKVEAVVLECGEPEAINHESETSPSHRIEKLGGSFRKTSTGIAIANAIGLPKMREKCPLFDHWLSMIEALAPR
jgi:hypothetical protein